MIYITCIIVSFTILFNPVLSQEKDSTKQSVKSTFIKDLSAKNRLIGKHKLSLQWISWDYFGTAVIEDRNKLLYLKGEQKQTNGDDFLTLEGIITEVNKYEFIFHGEIITRVSYINDGNICKRKGVFTFRIKGDRKYWRLQEMQNPCENVLDYVDIYFK